MMNKVLVLGASGFIGKALSLELAKTNKVIAFSNNLSEAFEKVDNIISAQGDFSKIGDFSKLLDDVDCVFHLISTTIPSDDTSGIPKEIADNIIPTVKLLESMIKCHVPKIIFASSAGTIYGETGDSINSITSLPNPYCSYGVQKVAIESYIKFYGVRYGLNYRIMRISNPYGIGQDPKKPQGLIPIFINKLIKHEPIIVFGDIQNVRDYVFLSDLIKGFIKVMEYDGMQNIFNVGFGTYYSIKDVIEMIQRGTGNSFVSIQVSQSRFCDVHASYVDMKQSQNELNWFPLINLEDGISLLYNEIQQALI